MVIPLNHGLFKKEIKKGNEKVQNKVTPFRLFYK